MAALEKFQDLQPLKPMDRAGIEARLRDYLAREVPEVVTAYLFGSVARNEARPSSDVDLAVLLDRDPPRTLDGLRLDLQEDLGRLLGLPVQLVILNRAHAELVHYVLLDGRLLVDQDPARRCDFEVRMRSIYFDFLPILRQYRRLNPPY